MSDYCNDQMAIPATYMRGGTSKGVFFALSDLPDDAQQPGPYRDKLLLRVIGSPDPYAKHTDGMGGATSSTSKVVILSKSEREDCDINYLFGQVNIHQPSIDWSGNCGNLTAAVGIFAIRKGLVDSHKLPTDGVVELRIWQENIGKVLLVAVTLENGRVKETGDFELDGVTFPAQEVPVTFLEPVTGTLFPTGNIVDELVLDNHQTLPATLICAGIPTVFVHAKALGLTGIESQADINENTQQLEALEAIRQAGAKKMGIECSGHIPKVAFCGTAQNFVTSSGKTVLANQHHLQVRAVSMGKLHHAMMGTAAVAIACAALIPGTLVHQVTTTSESDGIVFGHPSGVLKVNAEVIKKQEHWQVLSVSMSRSARTLMEGSVFIPEN